METRSTVRKLDRGLAIRFAQPLLVVEGGPAAGEERELGDRPVVIGRGEDADLRLEDPAVSRQHARLRPEGEGWVLEDLGSRGGTWVGGVRIETVHARPGLRFEVGDSILELHCPEVELHAAPHPAGSFRGLVGESDAMRALFGLARKIAPVDLPVLVTGESGTGKELLCRALHDLGPAPDGPYEVVDCTLLASTEQLRSELFGHVEGAFTGAAGRRPGAFERADGGTLVLDEVGELPLELQAHLLRALQDGEVRPLGGDEPRRVHTRVLASTHRDLAEMVAAGTFRLDLFYRLSALALEIPPLRARREDVAPLAEHFLAGRAQLAAPARAALEAHPWPGNVRELRFVLERSLPFLEDEVLRAEALAFDPGGPAAAKAPARATGRAVPSGWKGRVARLTDQEVLDALTRAEGNRNRAAELLGISRRSLFRRLKTLRDSGES